MSTDAKPRSTLNETQRRSRGLPVLLPVRVLPDTEARIAAEARRSGVTRSALAARVLNAYAATLAEADED